MYANSTTTIIEQKLVLPFLHTAFDIISLIGGLGLWALILWGVLKLVEAKLGPTGWSRASALTSFIEHFKWLIIGLSAFYISIYTIIFVMNMLGANINPTQFVTKLIVDLLFKPFILIFKRLAT